MSQLVSCLSAPSLALCRDVLTFLLSVAAPTLPKDPALVKPADDMAPGTGGLLQILCPMAPSKALQLFNLKDPH